MQKLDNQHGVVFKVIDAMIAMNLIQRPQKAICPSKFLQWNGLGKISHPLIQRLSNSDFVSI